MFPAESMLFKNLLERGIDFQGHPLMLNANTQFSKMVFVRNFLNQEGKTFLEVLFLPSNRTEMPDDESSSQHVIFVKINHSEAHLLILLLEREEMGFLQGGEIQVGEILTHLRVQLGLIAFKIRFKFVFK